MLDQLDLDTVKRLCRADLPVPVDVLNLIHFKDEEAYKWYCVLALPLLKAVGAEVGWMGAHPANTNRLVFQRTALFRFED